MSRKDKSVERKWLGGCRGLRLGTRKQGAAASRREVSPRDGDDLQPMVGTAAQLCEHPKIHRADDLSGRVVSYVNYISIKITDKTPRGVSAEELLCALTKLRRVLEAARCHLARLCDTAPRGHSALCTLAPADEGAGGSRALPLYTRPGTHVLEPHRACV